MASLLKGYSSHFTAAFKQNTLITQTPNRVEKFFRATPTIHFVLVLSSLITHPANCSRALIPTRVEKYFRASPTFQYLAFHSFSPFENAGNTRQLDLLSRENCIPQIFTVVSIPEVLDTPTTEDKLCSSQIFTISDIPEELETSVPKDTSHSLISGITTLIDVPETPKPSAFEGIPEDKNHFLESSAAFKHPASQLPTFSKISHGPRSKFVILGILETTGRDVILPSKSLLSKEISITQIP
jgi:hypothetical protein